MIRSKIILGLLFCLQSLYGIAQSDERDSLFTLEQSSFRIGQKYITREIKVFPGSTNCLPDEKNVDRSKRELYRIADFLKRNPTVTIEISIYDNSRPSEEISSSSCVEKFIISELLKFNIEEKRYRMEYYANTHPVIALSEIEKMPEEEQLEALKLNSRIELTIVGVH